MSSDTFFRGVKWTRICLRIAIVNVGRLVHLLHKVDEEREWCDLDKMNAAARVREQNNNSIVLDTYTN